MERFACPSRAGDRLWQNLDTIEPAGVGTSGIKEVIRRAIATHHRTDGRPRGGAWLRSPLDLIVPVRQGGPAYPNSIRGGSNLPYYTGSE